MDELTQGILCAKLLDVCDSDISHTIHSFVPCMNRHFELQTHNLHSLPKLIDTTMRFFTEKNVRRSRNIAYASYLENNYERLLSLFSNACSYLKYDGTKRIGQDRTANALSSISHIYFDTYISPIQFFLPHSSACSGKWEFWDGIDYFSFKERINNKEFNFKFRERIVRSNVWSQKFELNEFPMIVQRRLKKQDLLDKKLDPGAMIKAMIIRLGEMARPFVNYEIIDFSIRQFFTYLETKKYLRVDREILFLSRLDNEIIRLFKV